MSSIIKLRIDMTPVFSMFRSISKFKSIRFQVARLFGTLQHITLIPPDSSLILYTLLLIILTFNSWPCSFSQTLVWTVCPSQSLLPGCLPGAAKKTIFSLQTKTEKKTVSPFRLPYKGCNKTSLHIPSINCKKDLIMLSIALPLGCSLMVLDGRLRCFMLLYGTWWYFMLHDGTQWKTCMLVFGRAPSCLPPSFALNLQMLTFKRLSKINLHLIEGQLYNFLPVLCLTLPFCPATRLQAKQITTWNQPYHIALMLIWTFECLSGCFLSPECLSVVWLDLV